MLSELLIHCRAAFQPLHAVGEFIFFPYPFLYKLGLIIIPYQLAKRSMMLPPIPFPLHAQHKNRGSSEISVVLKCLGTKPHRDLAKSPLVLPL